MSSTSLKWSMATISNLTELCAINSTIDPSCDCLASGGGPRMNPDISGIGVRIAFYLQALFLACLSARSRSIDEITGALYTLITTNVAMVVTALILGFKAEPEISFHDVIVVLYLLTLSWTSLSISMPTYNCLAGSRKTLKFVYILHSYFLFAFAFAILSTAQHFGQTVPCNPHAVFVIFRPFRAIHTGINVACALLAIVVLVYSAITINDYSPEVLEWFRKLREPRKPDPTQRAVSGNQTRDLGNAERGEAGTDKVTAPSHVVRVSGPTGTNADITEEDVKETKKKRNNKHDGVNKTQGGRETTHKRRISGILIVELLVIIITWALTVMNTELLITRNNFSGSDGTGPDSWQFGQILSMFLVVLPLANMIEAFHKYKLNRREHKRRMHKKHIHGHTHGVGSGRSNGRVLGDPSLGVPHQDRD